MGYREWVVKSGKTDFKDYLNLNLNFKVIDIFRDVCCN